MIQMAEKKNCCGCQACAQVCPRGCITMAEDGEGFRYPQVDADKCVQCGLCETVCPVLHPAEDTGREPEAYAAYSLEPEIRRESSSGGIFTLLAEKILEENGVVYGAAMEESRVNHIRVTGREKLSRLRGSKYVQSDIAGTYRRAKADLDGGKPVLFSGTPCQIEGLRTFLRKDYEKLVCVDIICHGVPSPKVWQDYVSLRETAAGAPVARMIFRHKKYSWKSYAVLFEFSNKTAYDRRHSDDPFMQVFLHDLCLRPSCYECGFKKLGRVSDITLADFWGITEIQPEMDDDGGTSLVLIHSQKGQDIFETIRPRMCCRSTNGKAAIAANSAMLHSVKKPKNRERFLNELQADNFEALAAKYAKDPFRPKDALKKLLQALGLLETAKKIKKRLKG